MTIEDRIIAALAQYPKHLIVRINWKKRNVHLLDGFGNREVIHLGHGDEEARKVHFIRPKATEADNA